MKTQILEQASEQQLQMETIHATIRKRMVCYQKMMTKAARVFPLVEKELSKIGLVVQSFGISTFQWTYDYTAASAVLQLSIAARPNSGKFRFIQEAGYGKHGRGRNDYKLRAKAEKIETAINLACGSPVRVNKFSLEAPKYTNQTVLFDTVLFDVVIAL